MTQLKIFKTHPSVTIPSFATSESACFDVAFCNAGKGTYEGYNQNNAKFTRTLSPNGEICIMPGDRVMVPTGMILDIPEGFSVRLHPRSGLSLKQGLILANSEAVIDSDFFSELLLLMVNTSLNKIWIKNGERLAQGELVVQPKYTIEETMVRPVQRSNRVGGLGSTGLATISVNATTINYNTQTTPTDQPVKRGRGRPRKVPLNAGNP